MTHSAHSGHQCVWVCGGRAVCLCVGVFVWGVGSGRVRVVGGLGFGEVSPTIDHVRVQLRSPGLRGSSCTVVEGGGGSNRPLPGSPLGPWRSDKKGPLRFPGF